jgi:hypothetical protein
MAHSSSEAPYELKQLTSSDQEAVWEMLRYAAHEETASDVRSVPVLVKYAEGFGKLPGDAGFAAVHGNGETGGAVVGVAWVRLLPTGFGYVTWPMTFPNSPLPLNHDIRDRGSDPSYSNT